MSDSMRLYTKEAISKLLDKAGDRELHIIWVFVRSLLDDEVKEDG